MKNEEFKGITLQQMEALISIVEERTFSGAARKMSLTQPSLTKHIKNVEELLGAKLLNRRSRGITLTPEGKVLYDYAKRILKLREEAKEKIQRIRENESGNIFICASTIPATYLMPRVLRDFREAHPDIRFYMQNADSNEVIEMISGNRGEIGFVGKDPRSSKLHVEVLWGDRLVLAVPAGHAFARKSTVTLAELCREPFIIREKGSATREIFENCLRDQKKLTLSSFNVIAEVGSSEAVKEAVLAGLGVSVLSIHAIAREIDRGVIAEVSLRGCRIERHFYLIHRRQFTFMHHHKLFLDFVKNYRLA
ncbi:MAG TPA: selenium metabolism-associated LysR family transcriptional regulator [Syntrophales bacterium]|jgi:DNA-binding transcriptional LysR family regulator|nr:selenium metabolism-associated LysR family transcriptional regulator [Syntrophales bacterium]HOX94734.1 selenium metabolism-associated LysR family transcriptional regulator [Syntrophales bacterium]HPI56496.1 selenium metabolism-associated LysR family transcriptional regulator [Syntrophales bacterium]HPN25083.1 selenium metabolism-associated LysR family transcriptional regulator [Syntrophales bacterium]HQM29174.1 selenium metabolism-associated LysR family transcriptional regulator [Syntrophal